ncbi:MAG: hypothetical protein QM535_03975 [Limnohabitans sp.]|nr:hypothetical protein [Limnohabitans sp.]
MEDLLITILPIVVLIAFWIFMMRKMKKSNPMNQLLTKQDAIIKELQEIKEQLKELNSKK